MPSGKKRINRSVYIRYALLGAAELVVFVLALTLVRQWVMFSDGLFWGLVLFWIVKDIILFPFIWRAYDGGASATVPGMIGARGIAKERLQPIGYVQVRGELWRAVKVGDGPPIENGTPVRVHQMKGLTLYVTPDGVESEWSAEGAKRDRPVGNSDPPNNENRL